MGVPTTRRIYCKPSVVSSTDISGDVSKLLSQTNHRLYRQGRNYKIRVGIDPGQPVTATIYSLRPDWMVMKAWQKAFETFMNNSKEEMDALAQAGGKARWQDFRVGLGFTSHSATVLQAVLSDGVGETALVGGEAPLSKVHRENGTAHTFRWGGGTATNFFDILQEYQRMANVNSSPSNPTTTGAYQTLDDDLRDEQLSHLTGDGDVPPYDPDNMNNLQPWVKIATLGAGAAGDQQLSTGYFDAPCGFFLVILSGVMNHDDPRIFVEAKSGSYKGVDAESMGTAKLVKNHYVVK